MITEKEVSKAIEECLQEPITPSKREILADLIIIDDYLFGTPTYNQEYSHADKVERVVDIGGDSEFLQAVNGKDAERVWMVIEELMDATRALHPRMYDSIIRQIEEIH